MRYLYDAKLVPIGEPVSLRHERGQPGVYTFTEQSMSVFAAGTSARSTASCAPTCGRRGGRSLDAEAAFALLKGVTAPSPSSLPARKYEVAAGFDEIDHAAG